jgi:hypothetical protein
MPTLPVGTYKAPVTYIEPVNVCVLVDNDPKFVDPVTAETLDVIVCTTNVVAVIVLLVVILPLTFTLPVTVSEPVTIGKY